MEAYEADWEAECRPECWPPFHRKRGRNGRDYCPGAGDYRNHQMAELPGVMLCLAFLMPCEKPECEKRRERARQARQVHYTHGARECADYAEYEVKIPTRRFAAGLGVITMTDMVNHPAHYSKQPAGTRHRGHRGGP